MIFQTDVEVYEMVYSESLIQERFKEKSIDGTITCAQALALARELEFPMNKVAPLLSEMGIKIIHCQLGCFP